MGKKVGRCRSCNRHVYTNDVHLCKRCFNETDANSLREMGLFESAQEEADVEEAAVKSPAEELVEKEELKTEKKELEK